MEQLHPHRGDAADGIAKLKREDGPELQVHDNAKLIQTLIRNDLVDRYRLWVFPVLVGSGNACSPTAPFRLG